MTVPSNGANQLTASHDYNPNTPERALAPDTVLQDRYRIVRQLGRGGMGAVYEALDERLGITVALKETLSSEASMRKQFEHEARLLAGMQHPALPRVSDHFVEGNRAFLVMQFIGGVDLARIISQQPGPFPRDQVIAWADQLLDALIYLHSRDRQVIHRDIKPHNLKLTATGQIALLDFGLAKAQPSDPSVTSSQAFFGYTRHYAPLEQIQDQRTDPRSDIYALGATLYHLLTGIKPPDAMVRAAALVNSGPDPLLPANKIHEAVGPQIAAILARAMAQKPEDRYADANEFREALRRMGRTKNAGVNVERKGGGNVSVQSVPGTIHINDLASVNGSASLPGPESPVVNLALVVSARRFGPAGVTAVLALTLAVAGGILYGSQRWFPPANKATAVAAEDTATTLPQPVTARKPERTRTSDNLEITAAKTKNSTVGNTAERALDKGSVIAPVKHQADKRPVVAIPTPQPEKRPVVVAKPQSVTGRGQESPRPVPRLAPRKDPRPVGAPSIRFPGFEFRDSAPTPSPD
jgi:serine/threonine protein kinase